MVGLIRPYGFKKPRYFRLDPAHQLSRNMVLCWPFGDVEAGQAGNFSILNNPGVIVGSPVMTPTDKGGFGLGFNGTTQYVTSTIFWGAQLATFSGNKPLTFHCRVNWTASTNAYNALLTQDNPGNGNGPSFLVKSNQKLAFYFSGGSVPANQDGAGGIVSFGVWHSLTGVMDGANIITYIDGQLNATTSTPTINYGGSTNPFYFGAYPAAPFSRFFQGAADNIRAYNRALTASEVAWLHREPYAGIVPTTEGDFYAVAGLPPTPKTFTRTNRLAYLRG